MVTERSRIVLLLLCLIIVSLFFHLYHLQYGELSNDETNAATASVEFMHGFINPVFFGSLLIYDHPPIRILVNVPFILLFGTSEAVMRFPHALFGALATMIVYLIGRKAYGRKEAILACSLYAVSGVSAINNNMEGVGIYVFFTLLALYYLLLFLEDRESKSEARHLLLAVASLIVATYTYLEAVVFIIPVLYFAWRKKGSSILKDRGCRLAGLVYLSALVVYCVVWSIMPAVAYRLGYINKVSAGNFSHIADRASGVTIYNNTVDIFLQYVSYNSIFSVALLLVGITVGFYFLRGKREFVVNSLYLLPHIFVWAFLLRPIMYHALYDFPFLALLAAAGLGRLLDAIKDRPKFIRFGVVSGVVLSIILAGWHNYITFAYSPIRLGSKAAGYYVRTHSHDVTDQVFIYGTGSAAYYAGRLDKNNDIRRELGQELISDLDGLDRAIAKSENWTKVKYLIITQDNLVLWNYANKNYSLEAIVTVRGDPSLYILNTSKQTSSISPVVIISEQYEERYNKEFGHWRETLPWFLPMAQERL